MQQFTKRQKLQIGIYDMAFSHAPDITYLVRHKLRGKKHAFGYHKEVDKEGFKIGRDAGNMIVNLSGAEGLIENLSERFLKHKRQRSVREQITSKIMTSPENLAYAVFPIAEAIHEIKPDYILVLDRGGRIVGYATYQLYHELYGTLPTPDHAIHYQKISRRLPDEVNFERLKPIADYVMNISDSPKVFIIDDWMNTGITKRKINQALSKFSGDKIEVYYGVLRGRGKNVIGDRLSLTYCTWHGNDNQIGVKYYKETGETRSTHSPEAIKYRRRLSQRMRDFAKELQQ